MEYTTTTAEQTVAIGRLLGQQMRRGDVVALQGQLGAGKTQFVRGFAIGLGADGDLVSSPTFVLMQEYDAPTPLVHIDAYRIESLDDLESIGFTEELLGESVTAIEWAERIKEDLPADHICVEIQHATEGRSIRIDLLGETANHVTLPQMSQIGN